MALDRLLRGAAPRAGKASKHETPHPHVSLPAIGQFAPRANSRHFGKMTGSAGWRGLRQGASYACHVGNMRSTGRPRSFAVLLRRPKCLTPLRLRVPPGSIAWLENRFGPASSAPFCRALPPGCGASRDPFNMGVD
jgi:hypothetical protein